MQLIEIPVYFSKGESDESRRLRELGVEIQDNDDLYVDNIMLNMDYVQYIEPSTDEKFGDKEVVNVFLNTGQFLTAAVTFDEFKEFLKD